jgi:hypothetical protein
VCVLILGFSRLKTPKNPKVLGFKVFWTNCLASFEIGDQSPKKEDFMQPLNSRLRLAMNPFLSRQTTLGE